MDSSTVKCFACLPVSQYELLKLAILNQIMAAPDKNVLLDETKCYLCYGPLPIARLLTLALLRRWLLTLSPTANTSAQALVEYSKCYACTDSVDMGDIFELALLGMINDAS